MREIFPREIRCGKFWERKNSKKCYFLTINDMWNKVRECFIWFICIILMPLLVRKKPLFRIFTPSKFPAFPASNFPRENFPHVNSRTARECGKLTILVLTLANPFHKIFIQINIGCVYFLKKMKKTENEKECKKIWFCLQIKAYYRQTLQFATHLEHWINR